MEEDIIEELTKVRPEVLTEEAKKLFNTIMNIIDDRDKLREKNKELLKKLRNRVKEVKKLEKYGLYKKEFSTLNKHLEKKDKIIEAMAKELTSPIHSTEDVIEYFKNKVEREVEQ